MQTQTLKAKRLMTEIFKPLTIDGNKLDREYISITKLNDTSTKEEQFDNMNEAMEYALKNDKYYYNTYFSLATTDGTGRTKDSIKRRTCLAFDFDKKDFEEGFNYIDIMYLYKSIRLFYHALIDTGNGYHVYVFIEPTDDLEAVEEVQRAIALRLKADLKATLKTQIMRIPSTLNVKDVKEKKYVNIVYLAESDKIKKLPIEHYKYNYVTENTNKNIKYAMQNKYLPECVKEILKGSKDGEKNTDLQKLVVVLKRQGKTLAEIKPIVSEWQDNTETKLERLDYQTEYIYNKVYNGELNCSECSHKQECYSKIITSTETKYNVKDFPSIRMTENTISKSKNKKSKRKGVKKMNGNMLLIYSVLKNHSEGLYKEELIKEITYKSRKKKIEKCIFSDKTLRTTLQELEANGFIEVTTIDRKKFYKLKAERVKEELTFDISCAATYQCIKGEITPEEYELYCYMRYLNNKQQREQVKSLKGNLLRVNQDDLAKDLGVTQGRISQMIENLLDEKLLSIWYRGKSANTGYMYNTYLLNY